MRLPLEQRVGSMAGASCRSLSFALLRSQDREKLPVTAPSPHAMAWRAPSAGDSAHLGSRFRLSRPAVAGPCPDWPLLLLGNWQLATAPGCCRYRIGATNQLRLLGGHRALRPAGPSVSPLALLCRRPILGSCCSARCCGLSRLRRLALLAPGWCCLLLLALPSANYALRLLFRGSSCRTLSLAVVAPQLLPPPDPPRVLLRRVRGSGSAAGR